MIVSGYSNGLSNGLTAEAHRSQCYGTSSEKRKACCKVDRQGGRKHGLNLSPNLGCGHTFIREGRTLVCRSPGGAGCDQRALGPGHLW